MPILLLKMDLPDSVIDMVPTFLARKFFQVSFSIPTAFINISAEPTPDTTAITDHDYSPDSTNDEFVSGEQHIESTSMDLSRHLLRCDPWHPSHIHGCELFPKKFPMSAMLFSMTWSGPPRNGNYLTEFYAPHKRSTLPDLLAE